MKLPDGRNSEDRSVHPSLAKEMLAKVGYRVVTTETLKDGTVRVIKGEWTWTAKGTPCMAEIGVLRDMGIELTENAEKVSVDDLLKELET